MSSVDRTCGYYQPEREVMSEQKRLAWQLAALRETAARAVKASPGTRRQFEAGGLDPARIRELGDLRSLPLTRKRDFPSIQKADPPFGGFNAVPPSSLGHVFVSPGPIYDPEGKEEDFWNLRKAFWAGGFRPGDIVQNTFSYHLTPAGLMCDQALRDLGCVVVPTGVGNTEIQVNAMKDLRVTAYIGTPSFLVAIIQKAGEMGLAFPGDFSLELACVAGEILPPSMRRQLESDHGLIVRQAYITADLGGIGFECPEAAGLHIPDEIIVEILDAATGEPKAPGEVGEVVVTTLKKSYPLFRFATGDLSALVEGRCACGRSAARLTGIVGRADEVTKVRGMFIHPGMVTEVFERCGAGICGQAVVTRKGHQDVLTLRVVSEAGEEDFARLAGRLMDAARDVLKLRAEVLRVTAEELGPRPKRIDDLRTWE